MGDLYVGDFKLKEVGLIERAMTFLVLNDLISHIPDAKDHDETRAKVIISRARTHLKNEETTPSPAYRNIPVYKGKS